MAQWIAHLCCTHRCCAHTSSAGVTHFVTAHTQADAERWIRAVLAEPRHRRCTDCRRPIALKHLTIIEDPDECV